jgi:hypothetical protein
MATIISPRKRKKVAFRATFPREYQIATRTWTAQQIAALMPP